VGYLDLGPLKLGEILDRMFVIYRRNFLLLFSISGLPFLCLLPLVLIAVFSGSFKIFNSQQVPTPAAVWTMVEVTFAVVIIVILGGLVSWLATTAAVWQLQMGGQPTIRKVYRVAWHKFGAAFLAAMVIAAALFAGYLLLLVPAVFVALEVCLTLDAIVAEDVGAFKAISRSHELISGYRGRVFVAWLVCYAVSTAVGYAMVIPPFIGVLAYIQTGSIPGWLIAILVLAYFLALTVPAPLLAIVLCLIYYDARVRKEGFDLQRLLDELPPAAPVDASSAAAGIAVS
jgi:uncharacterized membrane protein